MPSTTIRDVAEKLAELFDVPETFDIDGQTFYQRCEAWTLSAIDKLEGEIESQTGRII